MDLLDFEWDRHSLPTIKAPRRVQYVKQDNQVVIVPFVSGTIDTSLPLEVKSIGSTVPPTRKLKRMYKRLCWKLTNQVACQIPGIHLRSFRGGYHIDHIVPISYGYKHSINPYLIASLENLRMLPEKHNLDKGVKLTPEAVVLLVSWELA